MFSNLVFHLLKMESDQKIKSEIRRDARIFDCKSDTPYKLEGRAGVFS